MSESENDRNVSPVRPPSLAHGINVEKPKFPQYAVYSKRLESFDAWPENIPVKKEDLVEAGLVYTGVGDSVRCYFCGGELRNWERDDVPMEEHAKWYPKCPHIILVKGQGYVERLINGENPDEDGPQTQSDARQDSEPDPLDSIPAQSCLQMGYSKKNVMKAITHYINTHGNNNFKAKDLGEIILDLNEDEETGGAVNHDTNLEQQTIYNRQQSESDGANQIEPIESLLEENRQLKQKTLCKLCFMSQMCIVFLPCKHYISCIVCAADITTCRICKNAVDAMVKVNLLDKFIPYAGPFRCIH